MSLRCLSTLIACGRWEELKEYFLCKQTHERAPAGICEAALTEL